MSERKKILLVQFNEVGADRAAGHHFVISQNEATLSYCLKNMPQDSKGVFISKDIQDWVKLGPYSLGDLGPKIRWNPDRGAQPATQH